MSASSGSDVAGEAALWAALAGPEATRARETLFTLYAGFARSIARRHFRERTHGDLEFADLEQFAYAGLLEAFDRFDPALGTPFRAFAAHRISGSVRDGMAHASEIREQISWRQRLRRERLKSLSAARETPADTGEAMHMLAEIAVGLALGFMLEDMGHVPQDGGKGGPQPAPNAYDSLAWKEIVAHLAEEVAGLPERERTILHRHYALDMTFDQLAEFLRVSKGRISQLHRVALALLRKRLAKHGHFKLDG